MNVVKTIFTGCLMVWLLTVASCALLGYGSTVMVESLANSDAAKKLARKVRERELERHNDRANREPSYHTRDDYYEEYMDK
jgi:Flp pilus assembly protein TadB